jgi:hypothetical protein
MGFDPYAFVKPKTKQDYIAMLDEAIRMGKELNRMLGTLFDLANVASRKRADG